MPAGLCTRTISAAAITVLSAVVGARAALPPVPVPAENPITEPKRLLGKMLFWDEQMSADSTVACASCHIPARAGSDGRRARQPGFDGQLNTPDDVIASPGVVRSDEFSKYVRDAVFGTQRQVTGRTAGSPINAAYAPELFWDGRASSTFVDPETGLTSIAAGGALESQSVAPPVNGTEMGHDHMNWPQITAKLRSVRPLALSTNIPADVAAALASRPGYPELFRRAFGDGAITADRVARAIATYERTLIADDTPWDRFMAGQTNALTPGQTAGWGAFQASRCIDCHAAPFFSDQSFRNIGLRPPTEDLGRQNVTSNPADRGRFKVPSLRNVGLKNSFMHNGQITSLTDVIRFYARAPGGLPQFADNRDPIMPQVNVPANVAPALQDFLTNGLTDARVRNETFPFDRPTLSEQRPNDRPVLQAGGTAGATGTPQMIAVTPPMLGNADFRLGVANARPGAAATVRIYDASPALAVLAPRLVLDATTVNADGVATALWPLTGGNFTNGQTVYAQWAIVDPAAPGGEAQSNIAMIRFFCGSMGCPALCPADQNSDGALTVQDIFAFLTLWFQGDLGADFDSSGQNSVADIFSYLSAWFAGCGTI